MNNRGGGVKVGDMVNIRPNKDYIPLIQSLLKEKGPCTRITKKNGDIYFVELDQGIHGWPSRYLMELCDME